MKNKIKQLLVILAVSVLLPSLLSAQTVVTRTTLSSAMAAGARSMIVTSATGITASTNTQQNFVLVESDLRQILTVSGTTLTLGPAKGPGVGHVSGATVVFGTPGVWQTGTAGVASGATGVFLSNAPPAGSCSRANQSFTPVFIVSPTLNATADCLGGKWVVGTLPDTPDPNALILAKNVDVGQVAYASVGTNTTDIATVEWLTSIMVPKTGWVTGIKWLCANTCTTDKSIVILRDSTGNVIANSILTSAAVVVSGANTYQTVAFTAPQFVVAAPGGTRYFVGLQGNGTAAGFVETIAASTYIDVITGQLTAGTFGTLVNPATMPTTFTAGQGPVVALYY